jgi:type I restriction enzyme S subunit
MDIINIGILSQVLLPKPPKEEQIAITKHLDIVTSKINLLIEKTSRAVELLKEHRTSLISSAVTGKIDVRQYRNGNLSNH